MLRLALLLPLLVGFAQDDATIHELIRKLDDADLEVRDKAVRELIQAGAKAMEPLRKAATSESAEVRMRATQAIRAIESDIKAREVCPPHKALDLKKSGTVGQILADLIRQTGFTFQASADQMALKATVNATTVLEALDQICAGQAGLSWTAGDDGSYRFVDERGAPNPSSYFEAFKVYIAEITVVRKSTFKETTASGQISIHAAWEPHLKPLKRIRFEFEPAKDDAGRALEIVGAGEAQMMGVGGAGFWIAAGMDDESAVGPQAFDLKGIVAEAKSIPSIKGTARVMFPLVRSEVAFDDPESGNTRTHGDIAVRLDKVRVSKNHVVLKFTKSKGDVGALRDEMFGRIDAASLRAIDETGKEHVGEIGPVNQEGPGGFVVMGGGGAEQGRSIQLKVTFSTLEGKELKRLAFKMSDSLFEKAVPFEIKDVKLP